MPILILHRKRVYICNRLGVYSLFQGLGNLVTLPYSSPKFSVTANDSAVIFSSDIGLQVVYDLWWIFVFVPDQYKTHLTGILGNYDGNKENDLNGVGGVTISPPNVNTKLGNFYLVTDKFVPNTYVNYLLLFFSTITVFS